jgi:hypothetical protein
MRVKETGDGRVYINYLTPGGAAGAADPFLKVGDHVISIDGQSGCHPLSFTCKSFLLHFNLNTVSKSFLLHFNLNTVPLPNLCTGLVLPCLRTHLGESSQSRARKM